MGEWDYKRSWISSPVENDWRESLFESKRGIWLDSPKSSPNLYHSPGFTLIALRYYSSGLSGVAATLFNRFFKFHSLRKVDYRDVAAACVFLAGKNEDSPKKLKYVVNQLWQHKFPHNKQFPSEKTFLDQCDVVTFLEEMVLKTICEFLDFVFWRKTC